MVGWSDGERDGHKTTPAIHKTLIKNDVRLDNFLTISLRASLFFFFLLSCQLFSRYFILLLTYEAANVCAQCVCARVQSKR